jgi:hypothetical protein
LPVQIITEHPERDVGRYLRHWANPDFVETHIQAKHQQLPADRRRTKSRAAAFFVTQSLEYLESATASSLLTKPLPLFYAAENLSKAVCLVNSAQMVSSDFRAHGLKSDQSRRNSIKNLCCSILPPGRDVWSRLFSVANADMQRLQATSDQQGMVYDSRNAYATTPPSSGKILWLGDLLRHIPELERDVANAGWGHPYVVQIHSYSMTSLSGPPASGNYNFTFNHAHNPETKAMIVDRESDLFKKYSRTMDRLNTIQYTAKFQNDEWPVIPVIRHDVFGGMHMDLRRTSLVLGETIIHFATLFILSSAVRYQPEQWKRLTDDHPAEAILVDRYLDLAIRKLPNLVLNELHRETYWFQVAGAV